MSARPKGPRRFTFRNVDPSFLRLLREIFALALVVSGYVAIVYVAFAVDWRLGLAVSGGSCIALGLYLATGTDPEHMRGA